ncbi:GMC oxidoreductase [Gemmatimonadota bacterium]
MNWDWLIVGSGFGGSISALRLAQKGYSVLVLEKGRRFQPEDFPRTNWNLKKWFWMPSLGFRGFFRLNFFRHLTSLNGVGVGGGSLVYANTLPTPEKSFFQAPSWAGLANWEEELEPHYTTARRMLGAIENPRLTDSDRALVKVAEDIGRGDHFHPAPVGVYFGEPDVTVPDPYHGGEGPPRTGCTLCGGCMTGCRYQAKNTLDFNYLWLAERLGVTVRPETEVTWIQPLDRAEGGSDVGEGSLEGHSDAGGGGHRVTAVERVGALRRRKTTFRARNVVFAGGVLGTVELLHRLRRKGDGLPHLSKRVGDQVRTNSEVLMGVTTQRRDLEMSEGIAITSILHTDDRSSLEPVRFASGSGFFRILSTPHAPGFNPVFRIAAAVGRVLRSPIRATRAFFVGDWARYTAILMYMRTHEGHLRLRLGRKLTSFFRLGLTSAPGEGQTPTAALPEATELGERFAKEVDGFVGSILTETLFGIPTTAHILGGACMGRNAEEGVIDHRHRVFGYPGLFVIDGSAVSANPGVNPSLTISALAERAMSFIPEKGESSPIPERTHE